MNILSLLGIQESVRVHSTAVKAQWEHATAITFYKACTNVASMLYVSAELEDTWPCLFVSAAIIVQNVPTMACFSITFRLVRPAGRPVGRPGAQLG